MAHLTKIQQAVDKLDLLVVAEPFVNEVAILSDRKDGIYILPVATAFENEGHLSSTNRSGQWRTKVVDPLYESKPDQEVMFAFAKKIWLLRRIRPRHEDGHRGPRDKTGKRRLRMA